MPGNILIRNQRATLGIHTITQITFKWTCINIIIETVTIGICYAGVGAHLVQTGLGVVGQVITIEISLRSAISRFRARTFDRRQAKQVALQDRG